MLFHRCSRLRALRDHARDDVLRRRDVHDRRMLQLTRQVQIVRAAFRGHDAHTVAVDVGIGANR